MSDEGMKRRVEERLAAVRKTPRAASIEATGNADAIRRLLRGHVPNADRLAKIAAVLRTTPDYLLGRSPTGEPVRIPTTTEAVAPAVGPEFSSFTELPNDVPVYGTAEGSSVKLSEEAPPIELTTFHEGEVLDYLARPPALIGRDGVYAVFHVGTSMVPRHYPGDPHFINPKEPPRPGDDVVVQLWDGKRVTGVLVKVLVRYLADGVELEQYSPAATFRLTRAQYKAIHRIVPPRERYTFGR